jgi:nucleoside permease NupC
MKRITQIEDGRITGFDLYLLVYLIDLIGFVPLLGLMNSLLTICTFFGSTSIDLDLD